METGDGEVEKSELWCYNKSELLDELEHKLSWTRQRTVQNIIEVMYDKKMLSSPIRDALLHKTRDYFAMEKGEAKQKKKREILTIAQSGQCTTVKTKSANTEAGKVCKGTFWVHQVDGHRPSPNEFMFLEYLEHFFDEAVWLKEHRIRYP